MIISSENFVLVGAMLLFVAVLAGKLAYRFGAPALLLFLGAGMLFGWKFISYDSVEMTQFIGMLALCIILFSGGMDTKFSEIRPVLAPGILLATAGVGMTAGILALFLRAVTPALGQPMSFASALLLAATMASTDSASVFSILRSKKQGLKQNLRPMLELESGSNDPMAYILTVMMVGVVGATGEFHYGVWGCIAMFGYEMLAGTALGYGIGRIAVVAINRINIDNRSLYSVLLLAFAFFTFAFTELVEGNGYLAVYIAGLVLGNHKLVHKPSMSTFFDGITWLFQIIMFLTLGLLVDHDKLFSGEVLLLGAATGLFLIFAARPLAVFACLLPFRRFTLRARLFVSWVGLRGAVPIIFATYPLVAGIEGSELMFNVVFLVTMLSLMIQGTTVSGMANWLGLAYEEREPSFEQHLGEQPATFTEIEVNESMLEHGSNLRTIRLPDNTLVMMVCRDGDYFVPKGSAELMLGDKLLVVTDRADELESKYQDLGIDEILKLN